jgi:hypothetical protein
MARITTADKAEVLRSVTIEEYGSKAIFSQRNGSGTLSVTVADPKRAERESLRRFIVELRDSQTSLDTAADESGFDKIIAELDERDEKATQSWGDRKPNDFTVSFWLEPNTMAVIANVYDDSDLQTDVRSTIREALSGDTVNTKGF